MERRVRPRYQTSHPVALTILGADPAKDLKVSGVVLDYSERGLRVRIPTNVPAESAVRVELNDQIILAEVCYCQSLTGGQFAIGLHLEQSLNNLDDLSRLVRALGAEGGSVVETASPKGR